MVELGAVFHDPAFVFQDGERGNKLFIALAIGSDLCTVARTTSKPSGKSRTYGCHNNDRFPNFFIPLEATIFPDDTWVCLDYLVDFKLAEFEQKVKQDVIHKVNALSLGLLVDLLECAIDAEDVTGLQVKQLRMSLEKMQC